MRWITSLIFLLTALAQPVTAAQGQRYEPINPPVSTESEGKVEVVEFFWYGCAHCYHLEPSLDEWLKRKPENVAFRRIPAPINPRWTPHARFFYAAELMGVSEELHKPLFDAIHRYKKRIYSKEDLIRFAVRHGVDETEFRSAWDSFPVELKVQRARKLAARYRVTGVPALGINGKYKTGTGMVQSYPQVIEVLDELVAREIGNQEQ
jgi:thiol:disulfide interchange protein DsbA